MSRLPVVGGPCCSSMGTLFELRTKWLYLLPEIHEGPLIPKRPGMPFRFPRSFRTGRSQPKPHIFTVVPGGSLDLVRTDNWADNTTYNRDNLYKPSSGVYYWGCKPSCNYLLSAMSLQVEAKELYQPALRACRKQEYNWISRSWVKHYRYPV